jgi:hypothetical protein
MLPGTVGPEAGKVAVGAGVPNAKLALAKRVRRLIRFTIRSWEREVCHVWPDEK